MIELIVRVENEGQAHDVQKVLQRAEEEGELDFPFGVVIVEVEYER